jgi:hypothetical protein
MLTMTLSVQLVFLIPFLQEVHSKKGKILMRNLISMITLTLLLSLYTTTVFAGQNDDLCGPLKSPEYTKGLYGLCNAYWNASENGRDAILINYRERMNPGDLDMPGLEPEGPSCPCLDALAALNDYDWGTPVTCVSSEGLDSGIFVNVAGIPTLPNLTTFFDVGTDGVASVCSIFQTPITTIFEEINAEEYDVCLDEWLTRCAGG